MIVEEDELKTSSWPVVLNPDSAWAEEVRVSHVVKAQGSFRTEGKPRAFISPAPTTASVLAATAPLASASLALTSTPPIVETTWAATTCHAFASIDVRADLVHFITANQRNPGSREFVAFGFQSAEPVQTSWVNSGFVLLTSSGFEDLVSQRMNALDTTIRTLSQELILHADSEIVDLAKRATPLDASESVESWARRLAELLVSE